MKVAVLLSGCGVYDGAEIHESVLSLLEIEKAGYQYDCFALDKAQMHVVDHAAGEEMNEQRNMLKEAARIARGNIKSLENFQVGDYDVLWIPGGFGVAKNFTKWALNGPDGEIDEQIKDVIISVHEAKKPIVALCMSPVVIAKALEDRDSVNLSVGSTEQPSEYDIKAISDGMNAIGAKTQNTTIDEVCIDVDKKVISAPCYMMQASIADVHHNISMTMSALKAML